VRGAGEGRLVWGGGGVGGGGPPPTIFFVILLQTNTYMYEIR